MKKVSSRDLFHGQGGPSDGGYVRAATGVSWFNLASRFLCATDCIKPTILRYAAHACRTVQAMPRLIQYVGRVR
ncbi:hypothetical protein [Paraburkholderia saeva]|uniref:Uncharacterized protein n=1 Tax=Paraburkholderia saeva TaxID=2777537 RepID=A0A9N8RZC9_9BURK|nr:hypothetical protein [Paraburkholderia saeva]CAG4917328.1 hypothetical protein LMG31841_04669 [Paraburkholderia saeva]